ncbi:MAG: hypothetical protein Q9218_002178 [Villophora microphyllina]
MFELEMERLRTLRVVADSISQSVQRLTNAIPPQVQAQASFPPLRYVPSIDKADSSRTSSQDPIAPGCDPVSISRPPVEDKATDALDTSSRTLEERLAKVRSQEGAGCNYRHKSMLTVSETRLDNASDTSVCPRPQLVNGLGGKDQNIIRHAQPSELANGDTHTDGPPSEYLEKRVTQATTTLEGGNKQTNGTVSNLASGELQDSITNKRSSTDTAIDPTPWKKYKFQVGPQEHSKRSMWSAEEIGFLTAKLEQGWTPEAISKGLPKRTTHAVRCRISRESFDKETVEGE